MNKKWLEIQYPYFHPASDSGGGNTADQSDVDALGDDNDADDNLDNNDDDNDSDEKPDKDERKTRSGKKDAKPDKSGEENLDKSDETTDEKDKEDEEENEEIDEDEEDEFGKEFDEKDDDEENEEKEIETEFTVRSLKDKYPKIFKDFPEVKEAIFRDREYTKLFGSIDEAQESEAKARYLDEMSQELYEGKSENLLVALKKNNEESLKVFAHGFLPQLFKTDKDLYHDLTDRVIVQALQVANSSAIKEGNKNLNYAVKYLSKFIFGDFELPNLKDISRPKEKTEAEIKLERKEQEFEQSKYQEFESAVHSRTHRKIVPLVQEGLDPRGTMSDFTKEAITDKIIEKVGLIIANDRMFQVQLASLWKRAKREGFSQEAKSRISTAYLARARKIIPKVRAQVRKNAQSTNGNGDRHEENTGKRQGTSSGSGKRHSNLPTDPKKIPASMSDEDILASD